MDALSRKVEQLAAENKELRKKIAGLEKQTKKAILKAEESDKLKSAFLANMSYMIRTPMNTILGFLDLLKQPDLEGAQKAEFISIVNKSAQRLLGTINDIVEISLIESGQSEVHISEVNIEEVMGQYLMFLKPQAEEKGLALRISEQIKDEGALIRTDKYKLDGTLISLINNAIKFTQEGYIEFGNYIERNSLVFYVMDTGEGIPASRLNTIFERFVQADMNLPRAQQGSGLGLTIAREYIKMLNGKIWVESEPGKGSTFYFSIPYNPVRKAKAVADTPDVAKEPEPEVYTVLIAEDDDLSYHFLEVILKPQLFRIMRTETGEDTVQAIKDNPDIAMILMDIKMPGMDGLQATRRIRKFNKNIPIIAQTAHALDGDREKALEVGCNDYISKPIKRDELLRVVGHYVKFRL